MSSDHSLFSSYEKDSTPFTFTSGTHKVKYHADEDWDLHLDTSLKPIDLSLVLPHYRARNQPVEHRMNLFISTEAEPVKLKVCRNNVRSRFYLEVQGGSSDVTVWLPSDFKGQIHYSGKATFSAGFINRIMHNVRFNEKNYEEVLCEDDVLVFTRGNITFRMWDVHTCAPENTQKEAIKKIFGRARKTPETAIDWDFLLED